VVVETDKQVLHFQKFLQFRFLAPFHKQIIAFLIQHNCFDFSGSKSAAVTVLALLTMSGGVSFDNFFSLSSSDTSF
jgi:hypothetical protein